jgi:hypothetical protein
MNAREDMYLDVILERMEENREDESINEEEEEYVRLKGLTKAKMYKNIYICNSKFS